MVVFGIELISRGLAIAFWWLAVQVLTSIHNNHYHGIVMWTALVVAAAFLVAGSIGWANAEWISESHPRK